LACFNSNLSILAQFQQLLFHIIKTIYSGVHVVENKSNQGKIDDNKHFHLSSLTEPNITGIEFMQDKLTLLHFGNNLSESKIHYSALKSVKKYCKVSFI
jgi:hypothetical protein